MFVQAVSAVRLDRCFSSRQSVASDGLSVPPCFTAIRNAHDGRKCLALSNSAVGTGRFKLSQTVRPEQRYKRHRCRPSNYGGV